jgi:GTP-binding protein EngB required for normal cell division
VPPDELNSDTLERFDAFVERDVSQIAQQFKCAYIDLRKNTTRPNVLVAGTTGAGKSSLINAIFGRQLAQEGAGEPITTHFTRYAPEDADVAIYDSRGLEHGNIDAFIATTRAFFDELRKGSSITDAVHVVWYVINGAGSRIQPFEEEICRTLFANLPIIFLINKADISSDEDRAILRKTLIALNLPSCVGIFDTVSGNHAPLLNVTKCPKCGSDDLNIRKKKGIATCEACETTISLLVTKDDVIAKTLETLPAVAREAFIAAQTFSCMHKDARAKLIIREYYQECASIRLAKSLLRGIARMLVRLAILWDFREHGRTLGTEIAQDLLRRELSFRDKLIFFLRKCRGERDRTTAMGVLWNRCLRRIFITVFFTTVITGDERPEAASPPPDWHELVQASFQDLNDGELSAMEELIRTETLDAALEREMPKDHVPPQLTSPTSRRDMSPVPVQATSTVLQDGGGAIPVTTAAAAADPLHLHTSTPKLDASSPGASSTESSPKPMRPQTITAATPHDGPMEEQMLPPREPGMVGTATAGSIPPTTPRDRERKKMDKSLRLDADDLADIEKAARLESELNALDAKDAKKRASLT